MSSVSIHFTEGSSPDHFRICSNPFSQKIYDAGRMLTKPLLREFNLATKLFGPHPRPGKSMDDAPLSKKAWRVVHAIELCTLVIPLIAIILAAVGICLKIIGGISRPAASLIRNNTMGIKVHEENQPIHIMTYNTALMPRFIRNVNHMRSSHQRALEIADQIIELTQDETINALPHVICLQECFNLEATADLCNKLKAFYPFIVHNIDPNETGLGSNGNVILSLFPITSCSFFPFPNAKGEDIFAHKGLSRVELNLGHGKRALVYNTHLQAKEGKIYDDVRAEQCKMIHREIIKSSANYDLVVLAGDFNFYPDKTTEESTKLFAPELSNLISENDGLGSTWYDKKPDKYHWGSSEWNEVGVVEDEMLDHIFLYKTQTISGFSSVHFFENKKALQSGSSDHLAVIGKLNISF